MGLVSGENETGSWDLSAPPPSSLCLSPPRSACPLFLLPPPSPLFLPLLFPAVGVLLSPHLLLRPNTGPPWWQMHQLGTGAPLGRPPPDLPSLLGRPVVPGEGETRAEAAGHPGATQAHPAPFSPSYCAFLSQPPGNVGALPFPTFHHMPKRAPPSDYPHRGQASQSDGHLIGEFARMSLSSSPALIP